MNEKLKPFLAGFELAGRRLDNGELECYGYPRARIDNWPTEVMMYGNIYTLENVIKGVDGYECGVYV